MKFEHNNISPLDSRYAEKIVPIREAFSEKALIKTRFIIEINWLLFLCNKMPNDFPRLNKTSINKISKFRDSFSDKDVLKIKKIESVTNHDVKAIEYFIADFFKRDKPFKKLGRKNKSKVNYDLIFNLNKYSILKLKNS